MIAKDIMKVKNIKYWQARAGPYGGNQCWVYLFFDPTKLGISELIANAWGLDLNRFVCAQLKFSGLYTKSVSISLVSMNNFSLANTTKYQCCTIWKCKKRF